MLSLVSKSCGQHFDPNMRHEVSDLNISSNDNNGAAVKHVVNNKNLVKTFYNNSFMMKRTLATFGL